jgi:hypothetical protein
MLNQGSQNATRRGRAPGTVFVLNAAAAFPVPTQPFTLFLNRQPNRTPLLALVQSCQMLDNCEHGSFELR